MASKCPEDEVVITSQEDIDQGPLSCAEAEDKLWLKVLNATGTLNFTTLTGALSISVAGSPQLEILAFPILSTLQNFQLDETPSLTDLLLPKISTPVRIVLDGAPKLTHLDLPRNAELDIILLDVPSLDHQTFENISSVKGLDTTICLDLGYLETADYIEIRASEHCEVWLYNLTTVGTFILTNLTGLQLKSLNPLTVRGQFILDNSTTNTFPPMYDMYGLATVGTDFNVTTNLKVDLSFDGLTTIGGDLNVVNNTNCTIILDHLTEVENFYMLDNIATELPVIPALKSVRDIHLRGDIDTSHGPNIFPALTLASGTVTIEAWNDFNCSKLISQQRNGVINNLVCNGTSGETSIPNSTGLSQGAWAGIGVSIGLVVIGGVSAVIWLILYFRRLVRNLHQATGRQQSGQSNPQGSLQGRLSVDSLQQLDGQGTVQEKPDDHTHEMHVPPTEKPDDQIHEMPSEPAGSSNGALK